MRDSIADAAKVISGADALVITAGAGMGVDSGLPDFRGREGFWNAYPAFRHLGLEFAELANPRWFKSDPALAWGFYGHRLNLYRKVEPHRGFAILRQWASRCRLGCWIFTSNVDGHFQRAGFEESRIVEIHGSIHRLQRVDDPGSSVWSADGIEVRVDPETIRASPPLPHDPSTGALARPNILMFNDADWNPSITDAQLRRYEAWMESIRGARLVVIELGAGRAIPTVRLHGEALVAEGGHLIRINRREAEALNGVSLFMGALEALEAIDRVISPRNGSHRSEA